ncbi:hypothetical protein [Pantoea stewartii]
MTMQLKDFMKKYEIFEKL